MISNSLAQFRYRVQEEKIYFDYDREADVAYFSLGPPQPAVTSHLTDDAWVRYSPENGEVVGFTILNIQQNFFERHRDLLRAGHPALSGEANQESQQPMLKEFLLKLASLMESLGWNPPSLEAVPTPEDIARSLEEGTPPFQQLASRLVGLFSPVRHYVKPTRRRYSHRLFNLPTRRLAWVVVIVLAMAIAVMLIPSGTDIAGTVIGSDEGAGISLTVVVAGLVVGVVLVLIVVWLVSRRR